MNSLTFFKKFSDEKKCVNHLKSLREQQGINCKKCNDITKHWWLENECKFQCSECDSRTNLKSGTIFHNSKVSLHKWFLCIHYMTSTKKPVSCLELQRQLEIKDYITVWKMMNKVRLFMGERDKQYKLKGTVEIDEGFFEVVNFEQEELVVVKRKPGQRKRGRGSERQLGVLIMVESEPREQTKPYKKNREMGYVKMQVIESTKMDSINFVVSQSVDPSSHVITDKFAGYNRLKDVVKEHTPMVVKPKDGMKKLPWVHTMISNCKREFLGVHHSIKKDYLQLYLNEFCFKVNRRNFQTDLFDRTLLCGIQN